CNALGIKPNVMAPGRDIISASYNFETTRYRTGTGTSQAAPHVAGLVALLRGKNPNATVDEVKEAILTTTRWGGTWGTRRNNTYGWGEIDCWAALQALSATNSQPNVRVYDFDLPDITPGDTVTGSLVLQNLGLSIGTTTVTLLPTNPDIEILDGSLSFGAIAEGDTVRSFDDLSVVVAATVEM
ncbi:MAG: S8 family serine peptidase, partial [bacterium]|nr:S8 family serine peptidase [bacterium]